MLVHLRRSKTGPPRRGAGIDPILRLGCSKPDDTASTCCCARGLRKAGQPPISSTHTPSLGPPSPKSAWSNVTTCPVSVRTCVRMMGLGPYRPLKDLERAIERGRLDRAIAIAKDFGREYGRPIPIDAALWLLPLVAAQRPSLVLP
jgi:hypothetical protein